MAHMKGGDLIAEFRIRGKTERAVLRARGCIHLPPGVEPAICSTGPGNRVFAPFAAPPTGE